MTELTDELTKRLATKPDAYTLAWWENRFQEVLKGYRGATHGINRALAEYEDSQKATAELRQTVLALQRDRLEDRAKIGELQARIEADSELFGELTTRVDRQAEFLETLRKQSKGQKA